MTIDLLKLPESPRPQYEERIPFDKVEELSHVPGIDDLLGKELSIEELSQCLRQLSEAGGEAGEPDDVYPYLLPTPDSSMAKEATLISPALALHLVVEAIRERHGTSGYQVRLK